MHIEANYLNIIKTMYDKTTANILSGEKLKAFSLRWYKTKVSTLTTIIQHSFGSPNHCNQRKGRSERNPDWKIKSKTLSACR